MNRAREFAPVFSVPPVRHVVAILLRCENDIGLMRRSRLVSHDRGLWHCVTGYLGKNVPAVDQAWQELQEETGLRPADLSSFEPGRVLSLPGCADASWSVHTFTAETRHRRLTLNWENDAYRWVAPRTLRQMRRVSWLDDVLGAVRPTQNPPITTVTRKSEQ